jgi:O-antigen ligase
MTTASSFSGEHIKEKFLDKTSILLILNHLIVLYAFFLPLSADMRRAVFFTIITIWILFYRNYKEIMLYAFKNKVIQGFVAVFIMYFVWFIGSDNREQAEFFLKDAKMYLYTVILYALTQHAFLKRIFAAFFLGMLLNEMMSYGIFFEILSAEWSYREKGASDPSPLEYSHLAYGFALSFTVGMVLFHWLKNRALKSFGHWVLGIFFLTATSNIFITGGRIGYILFAISIATVILFLFKDRLKSALLGVLTIVSLVYVLAYYFSPVVKDRVEKGYSDIEKMINEDHYMTSLGIRMANWIAATDVIKNNWLFGVGVGDHMDELNRSAQIHHPEYLPMIQYVGKNIHNSYFEIVMQFGVIGLITFGFLFYRIWTYDQPDPQLKIMQYLMITLVLIMGIVSIWSRNMPGMIFVSIIAFSLIKPTEKGLLPAPVDRNTVIWYATASLFFVIVAPLT